MKLNDLYYSKTLMFDNNDLIINNDDTLSIVVNKYGVIATFTLNLTKGNIYSYNVDIKNVTHAQDLDTLFYMQQDVHKFIRTNKCKFDKYARR